MTEEKHRHSRDKQGRESEQGKDRQQRKSMYTLETRMEGEAGEAKTSNSRKAHTLYRCEGKGK